jgi:hypothetical protein
MVRECTCFGQRRDSDRAIMTFGLDLRDLDAFMSFDVRSEANVIPTRDVAHTLCVTADSSDVEKE